jgi:hypothetical protein
MQHVHFGLQLAHSKAVLGRFFCAVALLCMLMAAIPTAGARAQDVETQTPTALFPTTTPVETQDIASLQDPTSTQDLASPQDPTSPSLQSPTAVQDTASLTPAPTSTNTAVATLLNEAAPPASPTVTPTNTATASPASPAKLLANPLCQSGEKTAAVKLDGITISVCAPILPGDFIAPDPSSSDQIATAATLNPYQEFSITAIPYGLKISTETLPTAAAGLAGQYQQDLKDTRIAQGGRVTAGPVAAIFGSSVSSIASTVSLKIHGDTPSNVVIVEWVADAGKRLWIIRYSQEVINANQPTDAIINALIQPLANVIVSSKDISNPSTSAAYLALPHPPPPGAGITAQAAGDLPTPSWWSGDCDKNNYPGSYAMGGIYKGVKSCGPINTQRVVQFAPGLWGELEWQCVELSMRFMYLAYGILPYSGNGKDVVWNYKPKSTDKVQLIKISNDTKNKFPQAGDVLSYGTTSSYGHTSVVTGSNVDASGNGTVTLIQQNVAGNGTGTLTVASWHVASNMIVTGWLHGNNPVPTISSISPTSATAGTKGLAVIAFGTNFLNSSVIRWNGTSLVTAFVSSTELIAAVPDSSITTGATTNVTISNPSPGGGTSSAKVFTLNNPVPALTSLSPSTALIAGSAFTLTVTGSNFVKTSRVLWGSTALTTTFVSATQLTAAVPAADLTTAGTVNITISSPAPGGGVSKAQTFTVNYRVPTVSSISPTSALANSSNLTLTVNGTYFAAGSIVRWNGANLTTTYVSSTKLTAVIPAANLTQAAAIPITVFNPTPGGDTSASLVNFNINNPVPTITGLSPDHLTAGTGTFNLTVSGTNFVSTSKVRWNGIDLATTFVSTTQLTAQVTAQLAVNSGWMNVTAYNPPPAGGTTASLIFKVVSQTPGVCVSAKSIALGASDTNNNSGAGSTNNIDTYPIVNLDMHGPEFTYQFNTAQPATVAVNIWDNTVNLKAFLIDGGSGSCNAANGLASGTKIVFNAQANHNYYFVVDGYQGAAGSYRITVDALTPTDGSQIQTTRPIFQWPANVGVKTYTLQVSTTSTFASLLLNTSTSSTSYAVGTALPANQQLYWRVKLNTGSYLYMPKGYLSFKSGNPPGTPKLTSPVANGLLTAYTPLLDWSDATLPAGITLTNYQVQVSTDPKFATSFIDKTTAASSFPVTTPLSPDTKYYWRVQALGSNGHTSNWSSASYFRAAMLPTSLTAPANTASPAMTIFRPTFSWNTVSGASSYTIQISTSSAFSSLLINIKASGTSYLPTIDLPLNKVLYWRVRAEGVNGPSLWSPVWSFTSANPPSTPVLSSPASNGLVTGYTPNFTWKASTLPVGVTLSYYQIQVTTDSSFTATSLIDQKVTLPSYPVSSPSLSPNKKYYWRVQAVGSNGHSSNWSKVVYFRAAIVPATLTLPANGASLTTTLPSFDWSDVNGASSYTLQVSTSSTFATSTLKKSVTSSAYTATAALPAHSTLYWRVQAAGTNGPSLWSQTASFKTP